MSAKLQLHSYWGSYNIPYYRDIYDLSGFGEQSPRDEYSHSECPRAKIFAQQHTSVKSVPDMMRMIRYNDWQSDPYSKQNACNGISARCDLNSPSSSEYQLEGGLDAKVSSVLMARSMDHSMAFVAQLGPTHDQQPVFDWASFRPSKLYPEAPAHFGQPQIFNFNWTTFSGQAF